MNPLKKLTEHGLYLSPVQETKRLLYMLLEVIVAGKMREGFDKLRILVVFNAGVPINRDDKAEDGKSASWRMQSLLRGILDRTYPLDQLTEAHMYVDTDHKKGNEVLNTII